MSRRHHYTEAEICLVRELYATHSAAEIARLIHGTPLAATSIYQLAFRLGLSKWPHYPPEVVARVRQDVRRLHAQGLTDAAIGRDLGLDRRYVRDIRAVDLGLPCQDAAIRQVRQDNLRKQRATLGITSSGQLRSLSFRRYARECGWPDHLSPREVQILNVLAERGPMTSRELAEAIGMRTDLIGGNGRPIFLRGRVKGGTYPASLLCQNLIVFIHRSQSGSPHGWNRLPGLYMISPEAIAFREKQLEKCS